MALDVHDIPSVMAETIDAWSALTTKSVGGRVQHMPKVTLYDMGSTHPYRNAAVVTAPLAAAEMPGLIDELHAFYGRDHGWVLMSTFPITNDDARLRYSLTEPIMVLDQTVPFAAANVDGLSIVDVTDEASLLHFERTHATFFPRPHLATADASELWGAEVLQPNNRLFVGYLDGEPVATGGSLETAEVNEITSLTTHPDHRGRGIARAMMRHAIDASDKPPVLFSSVTAEKAYERMGFRTVGAVDYWVPSQFEAKYPGGWD